MRRQSRAYANYERPFFIPVAVSLGLVAFGLAGIAFPLFGPYLLPSRPCPPEAVAACYEDGLDSLRIGFIVLLVSLPVLAYWSHKRYRLVFVPPPNWPTPPPGWAPSRGWSPPPQWPDAPMGWVFWVRPWRAPWHGGKLAR